MGISREYVVVLILFAVLLTPGQPNVLVDDTGRARIADFGLATVTQSLHSERSVEHQHGHTARWAAPEILVAESYSKEADIFSFAMVMIEVRRGRFTTCRTLVYCRFASM